MDTQTPQQDRHVARLCERIRDFAYSQEDWRRVYHDATGLGTTYHRECGAALAGWASLQSRDFNPDWWKDTGHFFNHPTPPNEYEISGEIKQLLQSIARLTEAIEAACCLDALGSPYEFERLVADCTHYGIDLETALQATAILQEIRARSCRFSPGYEEGLLTSIGHLYGVREETRQGALTLPGAG